MKSLLFKTQICQVKSTQTTGKLYIIIYNVKLAKVSLLCFQSITHYPSCGRVRQDINLYDLKTINLYLDHIQTLIIGACFAQVML